jgi:hypothetical protein
MGNRKWQVTGVIVFVMIAGAFAAALIAKHGADDDARRASDAAQRWYRANGGGQVRSCEADAGSTSTSPVYACQVVAHGCVQRRTFAIPTTHGQLDDHGTAAPLGPPRPKSC